MERAAIRIGERRFDASGPSVFGTLFRTLVVALCGSLLAGSLAGRACAQSPPSYVFNGPLLPLLLQMPANSWLQVNANLYSNVWTPDELRPLYGTDVPPPSKIIGAWSSFAWDSNRGDMILWGGGHANYPGNDAYRWRSRTLLWERASLPSEIQTVAPVDQITVDGVDSAPISSHTYKNQQFLPIVDRFITFGGAAFNNGGPFIRPLESNPTTQTRLTGPYLFDPNRADGSKVGGATGSHVKRVAPHPEILGGQMWQNRDMHKWLAGQPLPGTHVNGCTSYTTEGGRDVVYIASAQRYATTRDLYRYQLTTLSDPSADQIARVGSYAVGASGQTTCAYDPVRKIFLRTGNNSVPLQFWDLTTPGPTNFDKDVAINASISGLQTWMSARGLDIQKCSLERDPVRAKFLLWCGGADLWEIAPPPSANTTTGWTATQRPTPAQPAPPGNVETGVMGKWRYAAYFDVFVGLQNSSDGDVWIYKPAGWVQPNPAGNALPSVSITSPAPGSTVSPATSVNLTASASDTDGTIARVEWYVNGAKVGEATSAPFLVTIAPFLVGSYSVVAVAVDDDGGMKASNAVAFTVSATLTTKVLQRGLSGYAGVTDTFLDGVRPTTPLGAATPLWLNGTSYTPLVRFAIFQSEGGPVPDGAIVQSATLSVYKQWYDDTYRANALLKSWSEAEATWNQSRTGVGWSAPGAGGAGSDYVALPDALVYGSYTPGWMDFDVTARVRQWSANAATNFGWRLSQTGTSSTDKQLHSSEYSGDTALRPKLTIVYSTGTANQPPTVSLTSPAPNASITLGQSFTLAANATDADGTVTRVDFYANGVPVGSDTTAPYSIAWTPAATGSYTLTGVATDDDNATATSAPVGVTVVPVAGGTTVVLQRGRSGYNGVGDTFLDRYLPTTTRNAYAQLWLNRANYVPLVRFGIFQSEGGPVPDGATIQSATLSLYKQYYSETYAVYAMIKPWLGTQATWLVSTTGVPWSVAGAAGAGADYSATADALVAGPFNPGWLDFDVTARVRQWSGNPALNNGWKVGQVGTSTNDKQFNSSEWSDPALRPKLTIVYSGGTPNQPPTVSLTSPAPNASITLGQSFTLAANATDADGAVTRVDFYANGVLVGSDSAAPYSIAWTPAATGSYTLTAVATDDDNATATSAPGVVTVVPVAGGATVVLQRGLSGYNGVGDTFLDAELPTTVRGTSATLWLSAASYVPLLRFAIFQSEGGPVPNGATIDSATLSVYKQYYSETYRLNALLKPWVESQATWLLRQAGTPWSLGGAGAAGSDYSASADASIAGGYDPGWLHFDVTARVAQWSTSPSANYGWRLTQGGTSTNAKQFNASEYAADAALRPKLTVTYR